MTTTIQNTSQHLSENLMYDWVQLYNSRYKHLSEILIQNHNLNNTTQIRHIQPNQKNIAIIGLIHNIQITKNGHTIIEIEDPSGIQKVLFHKNDKTLQEFAQNCMLDVCIGVQGDSGDDIIYVREAYFPDVQKSKHKSEDEEYILFTSDIEVGTTEFLTKEFNNFLEWLNGKKHKNLPQIQHKITNLCLVGDVVVGIGMYPGQEKVLETTNLEKQYDILKTYLKKIPTHIQTYMCPGNHDAAQRAEPQKFLPSIYNKFKDLNNITLTTSPATVNIAGLNILLFHGNSLINISQNLSNIRKQGGITRPDLAMEMLIKYRHLSPTHNNSINTPTTQQDPLVVQTQPDVFATGHVHFAQHRIYKDINLLQCSCWAKQTDYQKSHGIKPDSAIVFALNTKTREIIKLSFSQNE